MKITLKTSSTINVRHQIYILIIWSYITAKKRINLLIVMCLFCPAKHKTNNTLTNQLAMNNRINK